MKITSPAFADKIPVPLQFTSKGINTSPPLEFLDVPTSTKSLVLIVEDLDSTEESIHWLVYNIPGSVTHFDEGKLPEDSLEGICSDGKQKYNGPCPANFSGIHRFSFKLYALDTALGTHLVDGKQIRRQMDGHILETAELIGLAEGEQPADSPASN